jgi:hypothetical protein
VTSSGFSSIGADELVLLLEYNTNNDEDVFANHLLDILRQYDDMFGRCLDPVSSAQRSLDERMGIRLGVKRMSHSYPIVTSPLCGIPSAVLYFYRPRGQVTLFSLILIDCSMFFSLLAISQYQPVRFLLDFS